MSGTRTTPTFKRRLIGVAVATCFAGAVHANPTGPTVVNGSASFAASGNSLTVTNTPGAIINWQQFSIRPDEVTRFIQSGAASAVLNRVTGPQQSAILGQLLSNGRVFLINPNGVAIGAGARIDTAGFVASSLNLSNEDFLAGRFRFADPGNAGKVTNAGAINAHSGGPVYLIAPTVENHGVITAPNGDILLAAGKSVELVSAANPGLRVQVEAGGEAVNIGQLLAESGRVGLYGAAIRNAGTVSADSASVNAAGNVVLRASRDVTLDATSVVRANGAQGGSIHVQAEGGTLLADGKVGARGATGTGGDVKLLGTQVGLVGNAAVDASGAGGGGAVLVGGDYQGRNADVQNAARTYVGAGAAIRADATAAGDGGKVVVWADGDTRFRGTISARGGASAGDGGLVEVSGKTLLDFRGGVDVAAPNGVGGRVLLDPQDILLNTSTQPAPPNNGIGVPDVAFADPPDPGTYTIQIADVTGYTEIYLQATRDITVANPITMGAGNTIRFEANNNINLNAAVTTSGTPSTARPSITLTADADGSGAGTVAIGAALASQQGGISISGASVTSTAAGTIVTTGAAGQSAGNLSVTATGTVNLAGTITANGGAAAAGSPGNAGGTVSVSGGTVTVGAINARGTNGAAGGFAGGSGGTVTVTKTGAAATAVTLNNLIDVRGGNATGSATGGTGGTVNVNAGAGSVATTAASLATLIDARGGTGQNGGTVAMNAAGDINIAAAGNKAILTSGGTASTNTAGRNAGNITIASTGGTATTRVLTAAGSAGVGAGANAGGSGGAISVSGVGVTLNGAVSAAGGNSVNAGAGGSGGTVTVTGTTGTVSSVAAGTINASGGRGQDAGTVNVSSGGTGTVNLAGTITANGGAAETGSAGQNGGTVNVSGGTVTVTAINALGSAAAAATNNAGGQGGTVNITKTGAAATAVTLNGLIDVRGGNAVGQGNGNTGGSVTVTNAAGSVGTIAGALATLIDARGGTGQNGGAVTITAGGAVNVSGGGNHDINVSGGAASANGVAPGAGLGRSAGTVNVTGASVTLDRVLAQGTAAIAGSNKAGGSGGAVNATATGAAGTLSATNAITASGGNANGTGVGGTGGAVTLANGGTGATTVSGAVSTAGGTGQAGGAIAISGGGAVNVTGALTASAGAASTGANGANGGNVTVTGGDVAVANVTTRGGNAVTAGRAGGAGGAITLNATDGTPTITLGGNLDTRGGNGAGGGSGGAGGAVTASDPVLLTGNRTVQTAGGTGGTPVGGTATFAGTVNSSGAARNLTVNAGTGAVAFGGALGNALALGALSVTANGIALPATNAASMTLTSTGGNITQTGAAVITGATAITGGAGAVTLTNAGNNFNTVTVASGASAAIFDSNALTAGPVTATGDVLIQTAAGVGNDLTLAGNVTSTTGNVTLASGEDINYGAFGPVAAAGRWLTYSRNPANNTGTIPAPGGAKPNIYNCAFGGPCGATVPATGNHNVYSFQPLLTYTANPASRPYGDPNPAFSGTVSGLLPGDTAADAYSGTLAFTSPAIGTTPVGGAAINGSGLTSDIGYGFTQAAGNATALTITPRPITLTAGSAGRLYGDPNPVPAPLYTVGGSGMANLEDAQALFGFTVASGAVGTTPVGVYAAGPNAYNIAGVGVGVNGNYNITAIAPGTLTITPAPLTITANDASRAAAQPNPPFSASYAGFKNAETPAVLGGALVLTTPATIASPPGAYAITPSGQTSTNYAITYVDGALTVVPLPVGAVSGVATADNAFITAAQRSTDAQGEVDSRVPEAKRVDCLELDRAGARRVLTRCF